MKDIFTPSIWICVTLSFGFLLGMTITDYRYHKQEMAAILECHK